MAIDGTYNCEVKTVFGTFPVKMMFTTTGDDLNVSCCTQWGDKTVPARITSPDQVEFASKINSPLGEVFLEVGAKIDGDKISGRVKAGKFGTAALKGKKT